MRLLLRFIASIITNSVGIFAVAYFVPGITFTGDLVDIVITGLVLAVANSVIKPILKFVSGPLIVLTLGLFMIIVNIVILWLVAWFMPELTITGLWAYVWGVVILAILNALTHTFTKKKS